MKNFVSNCFKFLTLLLLVCISSLIFNSILINYHGYKIKKNQNILILGDSHTEAAIDDSIIKNSINLSHSADSYFYSYLKLRKMKNENPQIDTLLLALSNHNLLIAYEDRWLFNTEHIKSKFRIYTDLMSFSDFLFLFKSNPSAVLEGVIQSPKYSIKLLLKGELIDRELGRFVPSHRNRLGEDIEQRKKNKTERTLMYSEYDKKYLFDIVDFCKNNNIELIFINTPIHPEYLKTKRKEVRFLKEFYNANLSQFKFFDYSELNLTDDNFQDLDHLNAYGAKNFSTLLNKKLNKNYHK